MKTPIIAIEGADNQQVDNTVNQLFTQLVKYDYKVEVFKFPRKTRPSAYFLNKYLNGEYEAHNDPYLATVFYSLDRYDAQQELKKAQLQNDVVIVSQYIGSHTTLNGVNFADNQQQVAYSEWFKGLEGYLLGNASPTHTYYLTQSKSANNDSSKVTEMHRLLCDTFQKKCTVLPYNKQVANEINIKITKYLPINKKSKHKPKETAGNKATLLDIIRSPLHVANINPTKEQIYPAKLNKHQQQVYSLGLEELKDIQKRIIKESSDKQKATDLAYTTILANKASYSGDKLSLTNLTTDNFTSLLHDSIAVVGNDKLHSGAELINARPRNQMAVLNDILFATTGLSHSKIAEQTNKLSYATKIDMINAYVKISGGAGLANVRYEIVVTATLFDILWLRKQLANDSVIVQTPSPSSGYSAPVWAIGQQADLYSHYFELLNDLHTKLSNTNASQYLVALGNLANAKISMNYAEIIALSKLPESSHVVKDITVATASVHPALFEQTGA